MSSVLYVLNKHLNPGYATPILYAGGIGLKTAQKLAFVKIISNYIKMKTIKKLGEDRIK